MGDLGEHVLELGLLVYLVGGRLVVGGVHVEDGGVVLQDVAATPVVVAGHTAVVVPVREERLVGGGAVGRVLVLGE